MYWCVVKILLELYLKKCFYSTYSSFLVINVCNQGKTLCSPCISFMQLGHLLTRSGLTYPEVSSKVYHDSFCQSDSSVSLPWVIYFEAFCLHVVSSFSCTNISFDLQQRRHLLYSVKVYLIMATPVVWRLSQWVHQHTQRTTQTGPAERGGGRVMGRGEGGRDRTRNKPIYIYIYISGKNKVKIIYTKHDENFE